MFGLPLLLLHGGIAAAADAAAQQPSTEALAFNCFTCHGTDGRSPNAVPTLNGKSADYLLRRMLGFKHGKGDPTIMNRIARGYTDDEIARVTAYIAKLK
jgi:sulfide dehydrogenase cytochrome subunit